MRQLVVGPEQRRLDKVEHPSPEVIGDVLPEAVAHAAQERLDNLSTALVTPVSSAVRDLARRDPAFFGEILSPAIGTAVRRAVTDAIAALLERINHLLESGLSVRSFKWRLEAKRTGRPYAEIVVARTLVYRVEWAVLIHTETSLVLEQASSLDALAQAPDQTAAMLQAINSFVSEALQPGSPGAALQAIEVGDLRLAIERDPTFTLAVAIRGVAPVDLRDQLRQTLERVHTLHGESSRQPDVASYADTRPLLAECLKQQHRETPKRAQWVLAIVGGVALLAVILLLGRCAANEARDAQLRAAYRSVLSATPGIVVTSIERPDDRYVIRGLRDPRAAPAAFVIAAAGLPAASLDLAPYESRDPHFAGRQAAMAALVDELRSLEQIEIGFEQGASEPNRGAVARAAELINRAQRAATQADAAVCVEIVGDSDETGSERRNASIRAARALSVARALEHAGVDGDLLSPRAGDRLRSPPHARRVTFHPALHPDPDQRGCPR